jgi:hypothetical protein
MYTGADAVVNAAGSGNAITVAITFSTGDVTVFLLDLTDLVTAPVTGEAPDTTPIDTAQYTGTVEWYEFDTATGDFSVFTGAVFGPGMEYAAVLALTAKTGYTFAGLERDSFTHTGTAVSAGWDADGEYVSVSFPETARMQATLLDLTGLVTAPVKDVAPDSTAIDTAQYTGTITWYEPNGSGGWKTFTGAAFAPGTAYRANLLLMAKTGWTFVNLTKDDWTCTGSTVSNFVLPNPITGLLFIVFSATEE